MLWEFFNQKGFLLTVWLLLKMSFLKQLLDFYIKSSIHVGVAVFSLVYVTAFSDGLFKNIVYPSCVFFGTVIGYNFLKYYNVFWTGNFNSKKYYWILTVSILAAIGFIFFFLWLKRGVQINLLISGVAVLVYPFLRKYGWLKFDQGIAGPSPIAILHNKKNFNTMNNALRQ